MRIKNAEFIASFSDPGRYLEYANSTPAPEFCVVGRSNVGKSTFINTLTGNGKLARTSSAPGRTRLINLFSVNGGEFRIADLPGYGYALASKEEKAAWDSLMDSYLRTSPALVHSFVLVDGRHLPSERDKDMMRYFFVYGMPFTAGVTKCDKLSRAEADRNITAIAASLGLAKGDMIAFDHKGRGRDEVTEKIGRVLSSLNDR